MTIDETLTPVTPAADIDTDVIADFLRIASEAPDHTALVHNGVETSYGDLASRVREIAHRYRAARLRSQGSADLIGVSVTHRPELIEHLFGVLDAGAGYCPVDAALPVRRKRELADTLGQDRLHELTDTADGADDTRKQPTDDPRPLDNPAPHSTAVGYVLCTSGSTGTPKPVVVSRHALSTTVRALRELFGIRPTDRVLQFASLGWDTCLEEILPALTGGAAVVFDDAAHSGSFPAFVRMIDENTVTVLDLPTAFWHELVLFLAESSTSLPDCIRLVVIGGERVDPTRLAQWRGLGVDDVTLLNTYGCTETTMITHAVQLAGPDTEEPVSAHGGEAPIGRPLPHVLDHVTDEGELLIAGPCLATEYLGLPEATAAGFPVADHGTGRRRWFHTGDIVDRGAGGLLHARGRKDEQVKIRGVRVHPSEVEAQLNSHPCVTGSVVIGERLLGRTALAAYVVATREVSAAELKTYLRNRLPGQFVPTKLTFVAALSYTTSGKVDRQGTRRAATSSRETSTTRSAETTTKESRP